jgi:hypothetical protein
MSDEHQLHYISFLGPHFLLVTHYPLLITFSPVSSTVANAASLLLHTDESIITLPLW